MGISSALAATTISFISAHLSKASSVRAITGIPQSSIVCFVCPLPILVPLPAAAITADVKCGFPAVFDRLRISAAMSPLVICKSITMPFVQTYSFEAVLKDGLSVFQNSRPCVVKVSKLFRLKIYFQTSFLTA